MGCASFLSVSQGIAANWFTVVEFDLRAPSMRHGKKGFSRLEWACKNVLNQSVTWLFYNFNPNGAETLTEGGEAISTHQPFIYTSAPSPTLLRDVSVPKLDSDDLENIYEQEDSLALLEWLHLVSLDSPRILSSDHIDSFLSRYEVPDFSENGDGVSVKNIVKVRWRGFIPPLFMRELYLMARKFGLRGDKGRRVDGEGHVEMSSQDEGKWFAMTAKAFGGYGGCYTTMQFAGRETLTWVCD